MNVGTRVMVTNAAGTEYGVVVERPRFVIGPLMVRSESDGMVYPLPRSALKLAP